MSTVIMLLVLLLGSDLETLLAKGRYQAAVASAPSADALLKATIASGNASGVVQEVLHLRGVLKDAGRAGDWLVRLSKHAPVRDEALTSAGYLYLKAGKADRAVEVLERARETGLALAYLADAYRRTGADDKARTTLIKAAGRKDAPRRYVQDASLSLAARLRSAGDARYSELLDAVGLPLKAAVWLKEDAFYGADRAKAKAARKRAVALFRRGLGAEAPAEAFWQAAAMATGDERFRWLVEAVRRGRTADGHAVPGAILDLARECAQRKRYVAALSLAQQRLRIGACPAAWEVIESLPPGTRAG